MLRRREKLMTKLLILTMCASLVPITTSFIKDINNQVFAASVTNESEFTFNSSTGEITKYTGTDTVVVIPSTIKGVAVTSIGSSAFYNCIKLTSITFPDSITNIGKSAFYNCAGISSVIVPSSVKNIGESAFQSCDNLTNVTIQNGVESIGKYAFGECSKLPSINIPTSVTSIAEAAFYSCTGLTKIKIPNSMTRIESSLFSGCYSLTNVTIPTSVTSIGTSAFVNCSSLTGIEIPTSVISIGEYAFQNCSKLTSITLPSSITRIENHVFNGCSGLTSITIPKSVKSIGISAFRYCSSLTSIIIPDSVTSIEMAAFYNCSGITSITIPNGVTNIGMYEFQNCSHLTSIEIPNSVTSISDYAFAGCTKLASITVPKTVTSIGNYAFQDCSGLTSLTIPESVTSIGNYAFKNCDSTIFYVYSERIKKLLMNVGVQESQIRLNGESSKINVTSITLSENSLNYAVGDSGKLTATVSPSNATNSEVTWSSSNNQVATVDKDGNVNAVGEGSSVITCTSTDGSNKSAACNITVTEKSTTTSNTEIKSVSISGTEKVGHKLKAKVSYDGTISSLKYKWQRASKKNGDYSDISGADEDEYKIKSSDHNKYIKLVVSAAINGQTYTFEDMTSKIERHSYDDDDDDDENDSASSNLSSNTYNSTSLSLPTTYNSTFPEQPVFSNPSGESMNGWVDSRDGKWYYLINGIAQTGWIQYNAKWYYLNSAGVMVTHTAIDGYSIDGDGIALR